MRHVLSAGHSVCVRDGSESSDPAHGSHASLLTRNRSES